MILIIKNFSFCVLFLITNTLFAQDYYWLGNGGDDDFFNESNWFNDSLGQSPQSGTIDPNQPIAYNLLLSCEVSALSSPLNEIVFEPSKTLYISNGVLEAKVAELEAAPSGVAGSTDYGALVSAAMGTPTEAESFTNIAIQWVAEGNQPRGDGGFCRYVHDGQAATAAAAIFDGSSVTSTDDQSTYADFLRESGIVAPTSTGAVGNLVCVSGSEAAPYR